MTAAQTNIARALTEQAQAHPARRAVVQYFGRDELGRAAYTHLTFAQLAALSDKAAHGLEAHGIRRGTKTVLMVTPGLDFMILTFALFKVGATIVMIDPGMGLRNLGACLAQVEPEAFVAVSKAHLARILFRWGSASIDRVVTVGRRWCWGGPNLPELLEVSAEPYRMQLFDPDETVAILFTSGSTGPAKGACYSHGIFEAQVKSLRETFDFGGGATDLATFPLFAIFDVGLGNTAVIPDMDASRPVTADPALLVEAALDQGCTQMFASPMLLDKLGRYGRQHKISLPYLTQVISAGAPVRPDVLERFTAMLAPGVEVHTPYGATESLPVSSISSKEILGGTWRKTALGQGICIGKPDPSVEVRIIQIIDEPIAEWDDSLVQQPGTVGEIVVRGPVVTRSYYNRLAGTKAAKIPCRDGSLFHRMGDLGRFDALGRLWFYGRKAHRVQTAHGDRYTVACEAVFNVHQAVARTALVGIGRPGRQRAVLCVELHKRYRRRSDNEDVLRDLRQLGAEHEHTKDIEHFLFHEAFPVDARHNAKIRREDLAQWAASQLPPA